MSQPILRNLFRILCLLTVSLCPAYGQLSGALSGSLGPGHFTVVANISVNSADTLRIEAGTTLQFIGQFRLDVNGTLLALGTATDSIRFTCDTLTLASRWRKIRFNGNSSTGSVLEYCIIEHSRSPNTFPQFNGGGVYCSGSSPYLRRCTFQYNHADQAGGAVFCTNSSAVFEQCTFRENQSGTLGGGLALQASSHAVVERCAFVNNLAQDGGAISAQTSSQPSVSYTTMAGNTAAHLGGAIYAFSANPEFFDCHFRYNRGGVNAGAAAFFFSAPVLEHCSIAFDSTAPGGAAVFIQGGAPHISSSLLCCTEQMGIYFQDADSALIEYCNISQHTVANLSWYLNNPADGPPGIGQLTQRNVNRDSCDNFFNIYLDPQIIDTLAGVYAPRTCYSPLIGAGKPLGGVEIDLWGHARPDPAGTIPEIGGFESEQEHPGIRGALTGNYGPGLYVICDTISVLHPDSARLQPGTTFQFVGTVPLNITGRLLAEGTTSDSIYFKTDTLTNPGRWRGMRFINQNSSGSRLSFCVVEHARSTGAGNALDGGAIYCSNNSAPQFFDCAIRDCRSDNYGGAVYITNSSPQFSRCVFMRHSAVERGGAVYLNNSQAGFTGCVLQANRAEQQAGGSVYVSGGAPQFTRVTICEGSAVQQGGGVHLNATTATLNSIVISHCTGAGLYLRSSPNATVRFDDVFGNSGGNLVLHNNAASNGPAGIGQRTRVNLNGDSCDVYFNIQFDPLYVNRTGGDLHLREASTCIDAGDGLLAFDADGTIADVGAYYFAQELFVDSLVIRYQSAVMSLSWRSNGDLFNVYGGTSLSAAGELLATVAETDWVDSAAAIHGLTYFYWVKAVEP